MSPVCTSRCTRHTFTTVSAVFSEYGGINVCAVGHCDHVRV